MMGLADLFPREVSCHRAIRVPIDAESVWAVVGDIGSPIPGGGVIEGLEIKGAGVGAIRTAHLSGGARIVERIEEYDPVLRRYVYRIIDGGPLDCTHYLGLAQVLPAGPGACILSWSAMAQPVGGDAATLRAMLEANLDRALDALANHLQPPAA